MYDFISFKANSPFFNVCTVWLYTLSYYIVKKIQLGLHFLRHWRSYALSALGFCQKPKLIVSQGLWHTNPYYTKWHCGNTSCLNFIGRECTLPFYFAEVYAALSLCWAIPNINTMLMYTLLHYTAELYPIIKHCWRLYNVITLLSDSQFFLPWWAIPNLNTPCPLTLLGWSEKWNKAELYVVILHCWSVPSRIRKLKHILPYYIAELFPILKNGWSLHCLIILLSYSPSKKNANVNVVLLHCCDIANLRTLLTYTLSCYMAELIPILKHCWPIPSHVLLLMCS